MTNIVTPATRHSVLLGLGAYRPERVVPNSELVAAIDSSDEWIRERTGIVERRFAAPDETAASMAIHAGAAALADSGLTSQDIDLVIVATLTHRFATPSAAVEVAAGLGIRDAAAFDVSAACAGFCYGLGVAESLVRSGQARNVLLVGTEKLTEVLNFSDRGTAFIFADGAGAVVVGQGEKQGIGPTIWGADGESRDAITMTTDVFTAGRTGEPAVLQMQGQRVFRWAVGSMVEVCQAALDAAGVTANDLTAFVPHQANNRITDAMLKGLKLPEHVVIARDVMTAGNTSAASVPLALDALRTAGSVKSGDLVLMVGFGAGLAYAAQVALVP